MPHVKPIDVIGERVATMRSAVSTCPLLLIATALVSQANKLRRLTSPAAQLNLPCCLSAPMELRSAVRQGSRPVADLAYRK
jgi:hypothetical protein